MIGKKEKKRPSPLKKLQINTSKLWMIQTLQEKSEKMQKMNLSISSIFIALLFLVACSERPFPIDHVYVIDLPHEACSKKKIVDPENLVFEHVEDLPLSACDGNISIAKDDFHPLKDWIKWAQEKLKDCRK